MNHFSVWWKSFTLLWFHSLERMSAPTSLGVSRFLSSTYEHIWTWTYIPAKEWEGSMLLNIHDVACRNLKGIRIPFLMQTLDWPWISVLKPQCSTSQRSVPLLTRAEGDHIPATLGPQRQRQLFLTPSASRHSKHTAWLTGSYRYLGQTSYCTEFLWVTGQWANKMQTVVFHVTPASKKWVIGYLPTAIPLVFSPRWVR